MHREESDQSVVCAECGESFLQESERCFEFGTRTLCWNCSLQRGGTYDSDSDEWLVSPDVAGLPDEAYGSSPHEIRKTRS